MSNAPTASIPAWLPAKTPSWDQVSDLGQGDLYIQTCKHLPESGISIILSAVLLYLEK
jgi:hypothetical protein